MNVGRAKVKEGVFKKVTSCHYPLSKADRLFMSFNCQLSPPKPSCHREFHIYL